MNDNAKRAVLVVYHGGGFASGSGNSIGFDGGSVSYASRFLESGAYRAAQQTGNP